MPRALTAGTKDQIEVDREFAKKLLEEERLRWPSSMEIPGDEDFARQLQDEIDEAEQSGGYPEAAAKAFETDFGDMAMSSKGEDWEVNFNQVRMLPKELQAIRGKYGIPPFMGMRANPEGYDLAHPPKGEIGMFASVLTAGFKVPLDKYERAILPHLVLASIQLTPNS